MIHSRKHKITKIIGAFVLIGSPLLLTTACSSGEKTASLIYTEDAYRKACEVTRSGNKPSPENIKYLTLKPQMTDQEGIFFVAAYNPLAIAQFKCASFVINDRGEQTLTDIGTMSDIKREEDSTMMIHIIGYTLTLRATI